jgi:hypothetical protein
MIWRRNPCRMQQKCSVHRRIAVVRLSGVVLSSPGELHRQDQIRFHSTFDARTTCQHALWAQTGLLRLSGVPDYCSPGFSLPNRSWRAWRKISWPPAWPPLACVNDSPRNHPGLFPPQFLIFGHGWRVLRDWPWFRLSQLSRHKRMDHLESSYGPSDPRSFTSDLVFLYTRLTLTVTART